MRGHQVIVVGAGVGGLASAIDLAARGFEVTVLERAARAGGKMREAELDNTRIDSGPTVFTMRWVFDELFTSADANFEDYVTLERLEKLARHAWNAKERFDLFADIRHTADEIGKFSGADEAKRFLEFCAEARKIYRTLEAPFLTAPRPSPLSLSYRVGLHRPAALFGIRPFGTLWGALTRHFHDPRLCQLFARYATYSGSSPFLAPATLMLIAHVEQSGVWTIKGGMQRLAEALQNLAKARGVTFRFGADVRRIVVNKKRATGVILDSDEFVGADAILVNADTAALARGLFGEELKGAVAPLQDNQRSLSAVTWSMTAETEGFPLLRHNVFFSLDYKREFDHILDGKRLPESPTVYVCAQDRGNVPEAPTTERLFMLINAPATGDAKEFAPEEIATCHSGVLNHLKRCGLSVRPRSTVVTTPTNFHQAFPGTGGALYGQASHGWKASFQRPKSATTIPGLYLAGGSTHPGAGVPMAALAGRLAAQRVSADLRSI